MLALREKHEYEQEIAQLKDDLLSLPWQYEKEIKSLHRKYRLCQKNSSRWRCKYYQAKGKKLPRNSRTAKARVFVQARLDGDKSLSLAKIAEKFVLSYVTIKAISYDLQKKEKLTQHLGMK